MERRRPLRARRERQGSSATAERTRCSLDLDFAEVILSEAKDVHERRGFFGSLRSLRMTSN
jgi:hypothetical protein